MIASRCLICYYVPWHFYFILWLNVQNNYLEEKEQRRGSFFKGRKFCRKKDRVNVTGKFSFHRNSDSPDDSSGHLKSEFSKSVLKQKDVFFLRKKYALTDLFMKNFLDVIEA